MQASRTHTRHPSQRALVGRPAPAPVTALALGLLAIGLAGCGDNEPTAIDGQAAAEAASVSPSVPVPPQPAKPILTKGYTRTTSTTGSGFVQNTSTYNAAGASVHMEKVSTGTYTLTFHSLAVKLNGRPHAQLTPVRNYGNGLGQDACATTERIAANGAGVQVSTTCRRNGAPVDLRVSAQVFDHDAPAAFATIRSDGTADNPRHFSRSERFFTGRYRVFFKKDPHFQLSRKAIAFLTPRSLNTTCFLVSIGSTRQRADEFGFEVDCIDHRFGSRQDAAFNIVALAQTAKTGYAFITDGPQISLGHTENPGGRTDVHRKGPGSYELSFNAWIAFGRTTAACWSPRTAFSA